MKSNNIKSSILGALIFLCINSCADELQEALDYSQVFKPVLLENNNRSCDVILKDAVQAYYSENFELRSYFKEKYKDSYVDKLTINDETVYLREVTYRGCGGACEQYQIVASKAELNKNSSSMAEDFDSDLLENSPDPTSGGSLFIKAEENQYLMLIFKDDIKVFLLNPDASWKKLCLISVKQNEKQSVNFSAAQESIKSLENKLGAILGQEGMCGSMRALLRNKQQLNTNLNLTMYRPWIWKDDNHRITDILEKWSKLDISHKIVFDNYQQQLATTQKELTHFYQAEYHWPKSISAKIAKNALLGAANSGFWFSEQYDLGADKLRSAILQDRPLSEIKLLVEKEENIPDKVLNLAIRRADVLDYLLGVIKKPDLQNEFNKTLLMYAAQYNQIDSAKVLLKHGANTNISTIFPDDNCRFSLSKSGMTALHYAVRYASAEFIELLLENGASPYLRTSEKNGAHPIDWFKKYTSIDSQEPNLNLSKDEVAILTSKLSLPNAEKTPKVVEAFIQAAETAYGNKDYRAAYSNSINAIGLDGDNERALSDLSLIALKMDRQDVALQAIDKLIKNGKDNQKANAWFNYGLICKKSGYSYYNGQSYCDNTPVFYFLESYKLRPTDARKNRIIEEMKSVDCKFSSEEIYISDRVVNRYNKFVYVLSRPGSKLIKNQFSWIYEHKVKDENGRHVNVRELNHPDDIKLLYAFEDYNFMLMSMKDYDNQLLSYKLNPCH